MKIIPFLIINISFFQITIQAQEKQQSSKKESPKSITIHQEVDFKASPQRVYEALLDAKQFSEFSARPAQIDPAVGGVFTLFDKHIIGRNIELIPNQRIVQVWRVVDWPAGVYSIAKFELREQGSGTRLIFDHTAFPEDLRDNLAKGWQTNYWDLLMKYFK